MTTTQVGTITTPCFVDQKTELGDVSSWPKVAGQRSVFEFGGLVTDPSLLDLVLNCSPGKMGLEQVSEQPSPEGSRKPPKASTAPCFKHNLPFL